jgi:hypothetical protein
MVKTTEKKENGRSSGGVEGVERRLNNRKRMKIKRIEEIDVKKVRAK